MINFKITGHDSESFLTVIMPTGKSISLKLGEIVKAEVMDILPSNSVTLKIKNGFITAKTEVPVEKGFSAFFKIILSSGTSGDKGINLQFMGYAADKTKSWGQKSETVFADTNSRVISKLVQELINTLVDAKKLVVSGQVPADKQIAKLHSLNTELLKILPPDINSLPKEIKTQIQNLLQASLKITGQSIQARLDNLISQINHFPVIVKNHPFVETLKRDLMVSMEKLRQTPLKIALSNTGVALEAKLRAIAIAETISVKAGVSSMASGLFTQNEAALRKDFKAALLSLRQVIISEGKDAAKNLLVQQTASIYKESAVRIIDGLVKDIETYQALSKTTDSFYTFLPLNWNELKDGEIVFKKGSGHTNSPSHSCRIRLDLEDLGKLSIMIFICNRELSVSFRVEDSEFRAVIESHAHMLKELFTVKGMSIRTVNIMAFDDPAAEQMEKIESFEGSVNIKA
jgi:flagellar hook-length control protein FliK